VNTLFAMTSKVLVIVLQVISVVTSVVATIHRLQLYPFQAELRSWDQVTRSNVQTGNVKTKPVSWETLAVKDQSAGDGLGTCSKSGTP
jgi:hypothetical protein